MLFSVARSTFRLFVQENGRRQSGVIVGRARRAQEGIGAGERWTLQWADALHLHYGAFSRHHFPLNFNKVSCAPNYS
jgi:hypothetical protein